MSVHRHRSVSPPAGRSARGGPPPATRPHAAARRAPYGRLALVTLLLLLPWSSRTETEPGSATGKVAARGVPEPIAVMAFDNLNQDPELDWLAAGMAETMLSDLRQEGARIVMRDALDSAIAELALQNVRLTDESSAARVGRLVGARTMVFGGYQTAAGQVRITARFVEVETSLVLDAAMVTGPLTNVLGLQDEIVSKLLGREVRAGAPAVAEAAPPRRRRPPSSKKVAASSRTESAGTKAAASSSRAARGVSGTEGESMLAAYRAYSLSLTADSIGEQQRLLEEALTLSPDFVYAREQLEALEERLVALAQARRDADALRYREVLDSEDAEPWQRYQAAVQLIGYYATERALITMLSDLDWIEGMEWEEQFEPLIRGFAAGQRMNALAQMGRLDRALEYGRQVQEGFSEELDRRDIRNQVESLERMLLNLTRRQLARLEKLEELDGALERFPAHYERLRSTVAHRTQALEERLALREEVARELEAASDGPEREELERRLARIDDTLRGDRNLFKAAWDNLRRRKVQECRTLHNHHAYRRAAARCLEIAERIRRDAHPGWESFEDQAIMLAIQALTAMGAYDEAAGLVSLYEDDPERTYYRSVHSTVRMWPAELRPDLPDPPGR